MSWGFFFSLTYFIGPMTADLGWSATEFSTVTFLNIITSTIFLPLIGRYVDQYGGRMFMIVGGVIGAIGIAGVAYIQEIWQFYLLMGLIVPMAMALYGTIVASVALANWFHKKRGRAFALASMGTSAGGVTFGPLASFLIGTVGWRETWLILSVIVLVGITVPAYLFMARRPEDVGLRPDGDAPEVDRYGAVKMARSGPAPGEYVWTRGAALRTTSFWLVVLSFSMSSMVIGAFLLHVIPFLKSNGLAPGQATLVTALFSGILLTVKPFFGIALERFPARTVSFVSLCTSGLAILAMVVVQQPAVLVIVVFAYALGMGGAIPMEDVTWANYFGRWSIGQIRGVAFPIEMLLGSVGPLIGAIAFDATGGYSGAFVIFAFAYLLAAAAIFVSRPPKARVPIAIPPIREPRRTGLAGAVQSLTAVAPASAAVVGALHAAEAGLRSVGHQPRVRRTLPVALASIVGMSAGLMVTLVSVPQNRRTRTTPAATTLPGGRTGKSAGRAARAAGLAAVALRNQRSPRGTAAPKGAARRPSPTARQGAATRSTAVAMIRGMQRDARAITHIARRWFGAK